MAGAPIAVTVEVGQKRRVFAWAVDWPGWCRSGKDETAALRAMIGYLPRYRIVARRAGQRLSAPNSVDDLRVTERLHGGAVTDFGAPSKLAEHDRHPLSNPDRERFHRLLASCWETFDAVFRQVPARSRARKPAVGRSPNEIRYHVLETDVMHLSAFGPAFREPDPKAIDTLERQTREQILRAVGDQPSDQLVTPIRRYGFDWTPRFAIRRTAWHALDHAWEIEDRIT